MNYATLIAVLFLAGCSTTPPKSFDELMKDMSGTQTPAPAPATPAPVASAPLPAPVPPAPVPAMPPKALPAKVEKKP